MIVYPKDRSENEGLKLWLTRRVRDYRPGHYTACVAVLRDNNIAAVVAWDNYRGRDIEATFAASTPRWATRQTIRDLLLYPFGQLKVARVTAMVHKSNKRSRRFIEGIGFHLEGKHRHAGPHKESVFSYGMTYDDFVRRYGKQESTKTACAA